MKNFTLKELDYIREGLLRQVRNNEAGARRQKNPSKAGDRKLIELEELNVALDKVVAEIKSRLLSERESA